MIKKKKTVVRSPLSDLIKWRTLQIRETSGIAKKYAAASEFREASRWYAAAAFHSEVKDALLAIEVYVKELKTRK